MANLLDQASIVLTPTAYKNSRVMCVKPSDASGDFTFSRNSAATRVNAQGLVENVQILSSNLVQNGSFSEEGVQEVSNGSFSQEGVEQADDSVISNAGGSVMTKISALNYNATSDGTGGSTVRPKLQFNNTTIGKSYRIRITPTNQSGTIDFKLYDGSQYIVIGNDLTTDIDLYFKAEGANILIAFDGTEVFNVDFEISLKEVGQDWGFGTGWSIAEDKAVATNANTTFLIQNSVLTSGKTYKITYTVQDYTSGAVRFRASLVNGTTNSGNGTYTDYIVSGGTSFALQGLNTFNGSITNISVKEVGQNWTLINGTITDKYNASMTSYQSGVKVTPFSNTGKFKVKFDLVVTSGSCRFSAGAGNNEPIFNTSGTKEVIVTNTTKFEFNAFNLGWVGTLDNVSVIEITDDTNLPRINYENFSYQDALGSELVVNGDFATDTDWLKGTGWTISGGTANAAIPVASGLTAIVGALTIGTTYKLTYTISNYSAGNIVIQAGWQSSGTSRSANGTYTEYLVCAGDTKVAFLGTSSFTGSIDNVSVKEYLGQEVVPDSGCGSWLFEPQSTNLVTQSELFSDAYWTKIGTSVVGGFTSPSGDTNAFKFVEDTSSVHGMYNPSNSFPSISNASYSIFVKYSGRQWVRLFCQFGNNSYNSWFDILNGVIGTSSVATSDIQDYGNGWFKITQTNSVDTINGRYRFYLADADNSTTYTGDGVSGVYIWGAQAENQSYATSYIPTSGATVTRNQDLCTNGGSLASINSTEGTLYAEIAALADGVNGRYISIGDGTLSNYVYFRITGVLNQIKMGVIKGGLTQASKDFVVSDLTQFNKLALSYSQDLFKFYVNGALIFTDTNGDIFPVGTLNTLIFNNANTANYFEGKTKALAVWKEALSDQELADLTYPTPTDPTFALDFDTIATDFTFARGSEATYVDAQGLIKSTNELGPELVTNGDFATDTDWVKGTGWSISGGTANCDGTQTSNSNLLQSNTATSGNTYKITYTITNYVSGTFKSVLGAGGVVRNSNGVYSEYITATSSSFLLQANSDFIGSIDNVSVKEYITATNTPRLDYSTGAEAFLLEPQSTNLLPYSEDFSDAYWAKTDGLTVSSLGGGLSPNGVNNADLITVNNGRLNKDLSVNNSTTYVLTAYYKGAVGDTLNMDLGAATKVVTLTGEWQRESISFTTTSTFTAINLIDNRASGTALTVEVWGAQLEQQSYATSYIPTAGTTVTRNQETCINATPEINSEEGVLYAEISALANDGTNRYIFISDGTNDNGVRLYYTTIDNRITARYYVNGTATSILNFTLPNGLDFNKIAFRYRENDFSLWANGSKVGTDTLGATNLPNTLTNLSFATGAGASPFFGNTKDVQVYTKALSDAELIKLTT